MRDETIITIVIALAIIVIVFIALREINCWYWKINERAELQRKTNALLEKLLQQHNSEKPKQ